LKHAEPGKQLSSEVELYSVYWQKGWSAMPGDHHPEDQPQVQDTTSRLGCGIEDSLIYKLGRWNSDVFLQYIQMSQEELARFSKILSGSSSGWLEPSAWL